MRLNRIIKIILIIANDNKVTVKYLADKFNISRKTIYLDLDTIILSGIPVIYGQDYKGTVRLLEGFNFPKSFSKDISYKQRPKKQDIYIKYIDHEQSMKHTLSLWEKFMQQRILGKHNLDPTIFHSWIRCQKMNIPIYEIDPANIIPLENIQNYLIEKYIEQGMDKAHIFLNIFKHLNWYAMTYDKDAKLEYIINPVTNYDRLYPQLGYHLDASEDRIGTNSASLALMENRPIITRGTEHYNKSFHEITSVAAPLYKQGELYGVFNVVFIHTNVNPQVVHIVNSFARLYEALILNQYSISKKDEKLLYDKKSKVNLPEIPKIYGKSLHFQRVMNIADYFSIMPQHVAIVGENGLGKSTLARYIHAKSTRKYAPCCLIDETCITQKGLREYIFGSEKLDKAGLIEKAEGGVLIIKNIHKFPETIQKLIARYIKTSKIKRVGGRKFLTFNVRIICTMTSIYTDDLILSLKEELLLHLNIQPLRHRKEDILDIYQSWCVDDNINKDIKMIKGEVERIDPLELNENIKTLREIFIRNVSLSN
ncbi:MAG: sigma 54-interacting transcriptional regulator [Vallitalea sp.]|jgi:transcriptional regulator of acetoin/glycerol metabolism|nr:sigma 54-interacting transcriptional regulator [Vallitalea sp.]